MNQHNVWISQKQLAIEYGVSISAAYRIFIKLESMGHEKVKIGRNVRMRRKVVEENIRFGKLETLPQSKNKLQTDFKAVV